MGKTNTHVASKVLCYDGRSFTRHLQSEGRDLTKEEKQRLRKEKKQQKKGKKDDKGPTDKDKKAASSPTQQPLTPSPAQKGRLGETMLLKQAKSETHHLIHKHKAAAGILLGKKKNIIVFHLLLLTAYVLSVGYLFCIYYYYVNTGWN